ncbi:unnamed protein product, partial [Discosporangium mesarthrocarpum]
MLPSGVISVACDVDMPRHWPVLPRVGLRVLLAGSFTSLEWFGRGPHENYPDRKESAPVRHYSSTVADQLPPYIRPGECGSKTDVRWLQLTTPPPPPLPPTTPAHPNGGAGFSFSALAHLPEDLASAGHPEDLVSRPFTAVSLDHCLMGVGGDDSWSACVHDEYLVRPGRYSFSFTMAAHW